VAGLIVDKLELSDMTVDWVWICLLALWQRWWPDRVCLELLDHKMQAGYALDAGSNTRVAVLTWLSAWSDMLRLCDATGISSIEEFDDRFPLTQSLYNWIQDLEMALENAGRDDRQPEADTNAAAGDLFNRAGFALVAVDARGTGASFGAREIKRLR
jgi:hypothetical protein